MGKGQVSRVGFDSWRTRDPGRVAGRASWGCWPVGLAWWGEPAAGGSRVGSAWGPWALWTRGGACGVGVWRAWGCARWWGVGWSSGSTVWADSAAGEVGGAGGVGGCRCWGL